MIQNTDHCHVSSTKNYQKTLFINDEGITVIALKHIKTLKFNLFYSIVDFKNI